MNEISVRELCAERLKRFTRNDARKVRLGGGGEDARMALEKLVERMRAAQQEVLRKFLEKRRHEGVRKWETESAFGHAAHAEIVALNTEYRLPIPLHELREYATNALHNLEGKEMRNSVDWGPLRLIPGTAYVTENFFRSLSQQLSRMQTMDYESHVEDPSEHRSLLTGAEFARNVYLAKFKQVLGEKLGTELWQHLVGVTEAVMEIVRNKSSD